MIDIAIDIDQERLAGALRLKRQSRPFSVLAAQTGVSASTLCRMERGQHVPTLRAFLAVCAWLDRPAEDFYEIETGA